MGILLGLGFLLTGLAHAWPPLAGQSLRVTNAAGSPPVTWTRVQIEVRDGDKKGSVKSASGEAAGWAMGGRATFVRRGNGLWLEAWPKEREHGVWPVLTHYYVGDIDPRSGEVTLWAPWQPQLQSRPQTFLGKLTGQPSVELSFQARPGGPLSPSPPLQAPTDEREALHLLRFFLSNFASQRCWSFLLGTKDSQVSLAAVLAAIRSAEGNQEALRLLVGSVWTTGFPKRQPAVTDSLIAAFETLEPISDAHLRKRVRRLLRAYLSHPFYGENKPSLARALALYRGSDPSGEAMHPPSTAPATENCGGGYGAWVAGATK